MPLAFPLVLCLHLDLAMLGCIIQTYPSVTRTPIFLRRLKGFLGGLHKARQNQDRYMEAEVSGKDGRLR